jgi:hypothetical protein
MIDFVHLEADGPDNRETDTEWHVEVEVMLHSLIDHEAFQVETKTVD